MTTFEQSLRELEDILRGLEDGSTGLEDSLARYERGVGLLKVCYEQLRDAEQQVKLLSANVPVRESMTTEAPHPVRELRKRESAY